MTHGNNVAGDEMQAHDVDASHLQIFAPLLALFKVILAAGKEECSPFQEDGKNPSVPILAHCECWECRR